jgi:flavin-dependent dehydrogenase
MMETSVIPATISRAAAALTRWQAVVVGAGPAGSATALHLARGGWRVLLVDRCDMPRPKVCGCCLSTRARDELRRLFPASCARSILGELPLESVRVVAAGRGVRLPLPAGGVLSRAAFDPALVRAAIDAGSEWLPRAAVAEIDEPTGAGHPLCVSCRFSDGDAPRDLAASWVVVAAGLVDSVRVPRAASRRRIQRGSRVGIGGVLPATASDIAAGELVMTVGRSGYCGIVRLEDGRIDVAAAVDRRLLAEGDPPAALLTPLREADAARVGISIAPTALAAADLRVTPPLTHIAPLVSGASRRIVRVGDAAGYVEPFTGEGMGWALTSSRILASALMAADDPASAYEQAHASCFRRLHGRCRRIAAALRHPRLVHSAIRLAGAAPWAARRVLPLVIGDASGRGATR